KSMNEHFELDRKSETRNYRLLAKYKKDKYSNALGLKEEMTNNEMKKTKDISNNMEGYTGKKKHSNGSPSEFKGNCKSYMRKNNCMFETKNYSHFEKKIFKEMDFMDFLKNNKIIILLIVDLSWSFADEQNGLWDTIGFSNILKQSGQSGWLNEVYKSLKDATWFWTSIGKTSETITELHVLLRLFRILIYGLPFLILGITLISRVFYYHKKVKKYERIKFRQR
ncbi:Plasmodium exported protein (Pm-fam-a like), unknown function, partial [Plasmodium malariae]